jgi:hypothetical protein
MDEIERMDQIGRSAMAAFARIKKADYRMWGDWMVVGEGLLEGRRWAMQKAGANRPEGKGFVLAYSEWLKKYRLDGMDKSDRAKLLKLMEERPAVEEWRASLTDSERRHLNNPVIVWRKWTAATRVKKPRLRTAAVSGAEHGRAKGIIEELQARKAKLEEEQAAMRARIQELEEERQTAEPNRDRKTRITELEVAAGEQSPSAARIAELEAELARQRAERDEFGLRYWETRAQLELRTKGVFTRAEFNKVRKLLHPDKAQTICRLLHPDNKAEYEVEEKRYAEAFEIFSRCENLLKEEPSPSPAARELPPTTEGLMERKLRGKKQNQERGRRAAATRARKKPGRQLGDGQQPHTEG